MMASSPQSVAPDHRPAAIAVAADLPDSRRIVGRLKLYFATLSCLGGLVLAAGNETESVPVIAVFFAIFGYVFVDYLQLFALPPIAAYAAMAMAALYCVSDFADLDTPGNHQMVAVARLLVFVQAILMLQKKSRRIFEQLGVFCLLELVVAAVFNNAISYGLLLIPIAVVGALALSLLAALSATEGLEMHDGLDREESLTLFRNPSTASSISVSARESVRSLSSSALRLPRVAVLSLAPSVLMVAAIFFYGLPRTTDAARVKNRGAALVGFSDEVRLEQIGQMMQSTQTALRLYIRDRPTQQTYQLAAGVYLRGRVLERYRSRLRGDRNTAIWSRTPSSLSGSSGPLPSEFVPRRSSDRNFYDTVNVSVICESMRSKALFAIAPYHRMGGEAEILHSPATWTLARRAADDRAYPRVNYGFGTHCFRAGVQSDLIAHWTPQTSGDRSGDRRLPRPEAERLAEDYVEELLKFDIDAMPTAASLASKFVASPDGQRRSDYRIAKAMERFFAASGDFQYTLNLDAESMPGVDPIEQFLSIDKKGHCQYFASALAMMLRSVGIPSRLVVGYQTDEFNELGQHYVARQLHAHSWVEALIARDQLDVNRNIYGQPAASKFWVRLDPTPAGRQIRRPGGGVVQMLDMAQNVWDDYVVDMDATRQEKALLGGRIAPISGPMQSMVDWVHLRISRIRAGELGGGALASRDLFSWPAAVIGVVITLLALILLRFRVPAWIRLRADRGDRDRVARPSIAFYAETLDQLARIDLHRESSQTPQELAAVATQRLDHTVAASISQPLDILTRSFYRLRFGPRGAEQDLAIREPLEHARRHDPEVDEALKELSTNVDLMMSGFSIAERDA